MSRVEISPLRRQWERSVAHVRLACGPEVNKLLPPDGVDFTDFYSSKEGQIKAEKLQKALTVLAEKQRRSSLETKLSLEQKRVLQSSSGKWASYLLTTFPSIPALRLGNEAARQAFRTRIGASPTNDCPPVCACSERARLAGLHALNCKGVKPLAITAGHDSVVQAIATYIRRASGACAVEQRLEWGKSRERPDFNCFLGTDSITGDVTVINTAARSYRMKEVTESVRLRAKRKSDKYAHKVQPAEFVPFVLHATGAFGSDAETFVKRVANFSKEAQVTQWTYGEILHGLIATIVMCIHRRNAAAVLQCISKARRAEIEEMD